MMERTGVDRRPGIGQKSHTDFPLCTFSKIRAGREVIADFFVDGACGAFRLGSSLRLRWLLFRGLLRQRYMEALSADRPNFCLLTADNPRLSRPEFPLRCGRFFEPGGCSARNVHVKFRLAPRS